MEFTELADYPLSAGRLTEWTPTVSGQEQWTEDCRPLAYTHEAHCTHSRAHFAENGGRASWIGAAFEIHHSYDVAALTRALRAWTVRHESFRTTVTKVVDHKGNTRLSRLCIAAESVDIESHVYGELKTAIRVYQHLVDFFETRLSPLQWPHCLIATVTTEDRNTDSAEPSFLLVFGADHSVMDAYSMLLAVSEIRRLYEFELYGTDPQLAETGSHLDFSAADRALGERLTRDHEAVAAWDRFLEDGEFPSFPLAINCDAAPDRPLPRQASLSAWLLSAEHSESLNAECRNAGHNMQSGILAALALTNREVSGRSTLRFAMPLHTRHEPKYAESVGWYVGVAPMEIEHGSAESFEISLLAASLALTKTKDFARLPYSRIAELLECSSTPKFVVSYVDVRYAPDAQEWKRWRVRTLRSSSYSRDEVYFWVVRSPLGINISARFPNNEVATANVHRFITTFGAVLAAVAGTGSYSTPQRESVLHA